MNNSSSAAFAFCSACGILYFLLGQPLLSSVVTSLALIFAAFRQTNVKNIKDSVSNEIRINRKDSVNQTDEKNYASTEFQTENAKLQLSLGSSQTETEVFSVESQSEKFKLELTTTSLSIFPIKKIFKSTTSQVEIKVRDQCLNTVIIDYKDREVQVWNIQNDVEINTTQSLNGPVKTHVEIGTEAYCSEIEEEEKEPVRDKPKHWDSPLKVESKIYVPEIYKEETGNARLAFDKIDKEVTLTGRPRANSEDVLAASHIAHELYTNESDSEQVSESKESIDYEKSLLWSKPAIMIHVSSITLSDDKLVSTLHINTSKTKITRRPLCTLFIAPYDLDFVELFGPQTFSLDYIDIYGSIPAIQSNLNDSIFDKLSAWSIGTYLSDFIVLVLDFAKHPDIHQDPLLIKYFSLIKDLEKPIYILHKTSNSVNYNYSFRRVNELMESSWENERVVLHEEISDSLGGNINLLLQIKEQMSDNLLNHDSILDLMEKFRIGVEFTLEKTLSIQNSRKRELLINGEIYEVEEGLYYALQLEPTWACSIREPFNHNFPKNTIYITPAEYHIDENISCDLISPQYSNISDHLVKVGIISNLPSEKLTYKYLQILSHGFTQHKEEIVLLIPSSKQLPINQLNHINDSKFDSCFQSLFTDQLADCTILSLFYEDSKLIIPEDNFENLARLLKAHYKDGNKKPLMVLHHYQKDAEVSEYFSFFLKVTDDFSHLLSRWANIEVSKQLSTHQKSNEGIYAFDQDRQIIHRLIVANPPIG